MSIDVPNFRILGTLGTGQGSILYKAKSITTGDLYAIKYVKVQSPEDARLIDQMRDEHACGSAVDHPALRKTFEIRYNRRRLRTIAALLFMEYVEGETLWEARERLGMINVIRAIEEAADGLAAMHRAGFVHADIKPGNILVCKDNSVKLIDFGQSSAIHQPKPRVQGTPDYMAPEQAARKMLDARTDVFGLGASLHRILTGKPVATEMNQYVDLHSLGRLGMRVEDNQPPSMEDLPPVVATLINDSCARDPRKRPPNMREFIDRCRIARMILAKRQETEEAQAEASESAADPNNHSE